MAGQGGAWSGEVVYHNAFFAFFAVELTALNSEGGIASVVLDWNTLEFLSNRNTTVHLPNTSGYWLI
ncbi:MAG: hypothetical protein QHJ82_13300 [Verrucomicrobiota bacterium]|nr:hypothetical protein [Verrucomicrobiota bacterium]